MATASARSPNSASEAATTEAQERARAKAFDLAKQHAQIYAAKAGDTLEPIQSISEDVNSRTYRQLPLPGQPTEQVVTAKVSVVYKLVGP
ncbi:SIMPL domain-containing protein [Kouleothrix sp.]|uniref:SIMPL domain-containing protein n=1 Tax=Kouleothrix sp. TaxID=2779161 RepID=UPI003919C197